MNTNGNQSATSLQIARRLLARLGQENESERVAELQQTCLRVSENLRNSVGEDGLTALLVRAIARTEANHPALRIIQRHTQGNPHLNGVAASVEAHGLTAVSAAIEALLAALVDILSRLIGEDMTIRLIDHGAPRSRTDAGAQVHD